MPSHSSKHTTGIRLLLFVWLLFSGSTLKAQLEAQLDNHERYRRVPVIGRVTEGGAPIALDPPSDDEVLQAFEKDRATRGGFPLLLEKHRNNLKIVKEKIADYVDPPSDVPLIGMANLHHAHYKCMIYLSERTINGWPAPHTLEDKDASEVIYIDHNHFHICGDGQAPVSPAPHASHTFNFSPGFERGESLESLKQRYNELEQQTHQLANKLKQSRSPTETERKELQLAVRKSFEARQALQRAELADLAQRMKSMQQSIDMRDKLAEEVVERRVEDLLNPNLKWDVTRTSSESTRSIAKEDFISPTKITSSQEMRAAIQGTWNVRVFQMEYQGDDRVSQVVIRGDLLLVHTIVNGKVLGVSPWRLVWPNAERPYELSVIWDPNSNADSNSAAPGRIAYDGNSFQLAWGENPNAICPGENVTYIDCVRGNIDDRSIAPQTTTPTLPEATERPEPDAVRQPIAKAIWEIVSQLPLEDNQKPPFRIVITEIESFPKEFDSKPKEQLADFKEEIREQIASELQTYAHLIVASRKVAEVTLSSLQLKAKDLIIPDKHAQYFEALKKEGQPAQAILLAKLIQEDSTRYFLALELIDRSGLSYKSSADFSKANPENSIAEANSSLLSQSIAAAKFDTPQALLARVDESSKAGSYEEFLALFSNEGVRDLAGSLLMQAVMQTSIDDLSRQLAFGGVAEVEPDFVAFRKVLQRWLPQSVTTAQLEAMGKGLSTIMSSIGGASPDHAALSEFVISLRESVAGIGDHRKFCIEIMQAFEKRTKRKFVYFGTADHENEWQISPFGDRAIATLIDGSPGMATTITMRRVSGAWRISSLFNELVIEAQPATKSPKFNSIAPESTGSDMRSDCSR